MGKIKSAKELAMERTAGINDTAEAGDFAREQYIKAAVTLAGSYMAGNNELERIIDGLERYPAGVKSAAVETFLRNITVDMNPDNCHLAAEAWLKLDPAGSRKDAAEAVKELAGRYRQALEAARASAGEEDRETVLEDLRRAGIGGSAIAGVNPDRSPGWKRQRSEIAARFADELDGLKKLLAP